MRAAVTRKQPRKGTEKARVEAVSRRASATVASYLLSIPQKDRPLAVRAMGRRLATLLAISEGGASAASFFSVLEGEAYRHSPSVPPKAETEADRVFGKTVEAANG